MDQLPLDDLEEPQEPQQSIYALRDPVSGEIHYIGRTYKPRTRLTGHINAPGSYALLAWMNSLTSRGLTPAMEVLYQCDESEVNSIERFFIERYQRSGHPLLNGGRHPLRHESGPSQHPAGDAAAALESEIRMLFWRTPANHPKLLAMQRTAIRVAWERAQAEMQPFLKQLDAEDKESA